MTRPALVCPNEACPKFNQPTRFMGGCDCGATLVEPKPAEPTLKQMEDLAVVMGFGSLLWLPEPKRTEGLRAFHNLVQQSANGDPAANTRLALMKQTRDRIEAANESD